MVDMVTGVKIRPMTMDDVAAVAAMEAEIFTDPWSEKLYRETLESGRYDCQVLEITELDVNGLEKGSLLAGYFCGQVILDEAEVHRIAVDPVMRGRGYGQVLLEDFLCRVQQTGVVTVMRRSVQEIRLPSAFMKRMDLPTSGFAKAITRIPKKMRRSCKRFFDRIFHHRGTCFSCIL